MVTNWNLWDTGKHADIKIICRGYHWFLHRSILASRCAWFNERIKELEKDGKYDKYYVLDLDELLFAPVRCLLYFIYHGDIVHGQLREMSSWYDKALAELYDVSIKLEFPQFGKALLALCKEHLYLTLQYYKANPKAEMPHYQIDKFLRGVRIAYAGDDDDQAKLRRAYVKFFARIHRTIKMDKYFFREIRSVPMFSADLLEYLGLSGWKR
ncbi:hypothetical protein PG993_010883 [Apiospora rasikravindrae]|uniref:BTB domain-containing protein n=1 Tax=Apiospora rasikravindrae TaxID=990691 RepID=A0ABR1SEW8_9PEZI